MENQNLSKQKTENHIKKFSNKKISAENDLADDMNQKKASKAEPSNKSLDAEDHLSDSPKGSGKTSSPYKKMSGEKSLQDTPSFRKSNGKGNTKLKPESELANDMNQKKGSKSTPSNNKLDAESSLSDNFTYMMGFNKFINESYEG